MDPPIPCIYLLFSSWVSLILPFLALLCLRVLGSLWLLFFICEDKCWLHCRWAIYLSIWGCRIDCWGSQNDIIMEFMISQRPKSMHLMQLFQVCLHWSVIFIVSKPGKGMSRRGTTEFHLKSTNHSCHYCGVWQIQQRKKVWTRQLRNWSLSMFPSEFILNLGWKINGSLILNTGVIISERR